MIPDTMTVGDFVTMFETIDRDNSIGWITESTVLVCGFASISINN